MQDGIADMKLINPIIPHISEYQVHMEICKIALRIRIQKNLCRWMAVW
jgi:hypothetical protein